MVYSTEPAGVMTSGMEAACSGEGHTCVSPKASPGEDSSPHDAGVVFGISEGTFVVVEDDDIHMTVGLYDFFMANKASDAMRVYLHLFRTSRRQDTRSVWANTTYISKGCGIGQGRVKAAKAWLADKGIIQYRQDPSKVGRGKSKVYIVLRTRLSGGTESRIPDNQATREPTDEVLREQEKFKENKEYPVATLPVVASKKGHTPEQVATFKALADIFYTRSGKWQHGAKEATALYKLLDYASERPEFPALLVEAFWKLHTGELYGMTDSEKRWWASIPYVPSRLDAKAVEAMMERVEDNNRVSPEFLAQLEKDWGPKIRKRQALEAK